MLSKVDRGYNTNRHGDIEDAVTMSLLLRLLLLFLRYHETYDCSLISF